MTPDSPSSSAGSTASCPTRPSSSSSLQTTSSSTTSTMPSGTLSSHTVSARSPKSHNLGSVCLRPSLPLRHLLDACKVPSCDPQTNISIKRTTSSDFFSLSFVSPGFHRVYLTKGEKKAESQFDSNFFVCQFNERPNRSDKHGLRSALGLDQIHRSCHYPAPSSTHRT